MKSHIDNLKSEETDLNRQLEALNKDLSELDEKRH
jgi:peptidoglycan hydrolase CwlO-like protein